MLTASRPPLRRILALDRLIRSGTYPNCRTAAEQLEVHPRTVHRDIDFLRDSWGAPVEFCRMHNGFYYRDPDYALPLLRLTEGELVALFLADRLLQQYQGTPFAKSIATAFHKLTAALPDKVSVDLSHIDQAFSFRQRPVSVGDAKRFQQLSRAVQQGKQLEIVYWTASRDETTRRVIDPYHLVSVEGDWYVVGFCHLREDVRMFSPSRIRQIRETGEKFDAPKDFQIQDYLDPSFRTFRGKAAQRVKLRFAPTIAYVIKEKTWHPSQRLEPQSDGGLIMTLNVTHLLELRRWVMSWGAECEVLEPEELRAEIKKESQRAAAMY